MARFGTGFVNVGRIFGANKENTDDMLAKDFKPVANTARNVYGLIGKNQVRGSVPLQEAAAKSDRDVSALGPKGRSAGQGMDRALFRQGAGPELDEMRSKFSNLTKVFGERENYLRENPAKLQKVQVEETKPVDPYLDPAKNPSTFREDTKGGYGVQAIGDEKQAIYDGNYDAWNAAGRPPYHWWLKNRATLAGNTTQGVDQNTGKPKDQFTDPEGS